MKTFWRVLWLISGVLEIAAGIFCIIRPDVAMLSFVYILGIFVLLYGVSAVAYYFVAGRHFLGSFWVFIVGILSAVIGCVVLFTGTSVALASAMPYIFGIWMVCKGLMALGHSFDAHKLFIPNWYALTIFGVFCLVLGVLSFIKPIVGATTFGILMGLYFVFSGVLAIVQWVFAGKVRKDIRTAGKALDDGIEVTIE